MEHRAATEEVIKLIPKMAGRSPSDVLVETAISKKWAPAQLHKVAQVFNTCSTLHAQSVDRNSIPELVDAPEVVNLYVERSGRSKMKAASSFMSDGPVETLEKAAAAEQATDSPEVPYVFGTAPLKLAAQERPLDEKMLRRWKIEDFRKAAHHVIDRVDTILDAKAAHRGSLQKCASTLQTHRRLYGDDFMANLERDARACRDKGIVAHAFDLIEGFAKDAGIAVERFDPERHKDALIGRDSTGALTLVDDVHRSFVKLACEIQHFSEDLEALLKTANELPDDAQRVAGQIMDRVKVAVAGVDDFFKLAAQPAPAPGGQSRSSGTTVNRRSGLSAFEEALLASRQAEEKAEDTPEGSDARSRADLAANEALIELPLAALSTTVEKAKEVRTPVVELIKDLHSPEGTLSSNLKPYSERYTRRQADLQSRLDTHAQDLLAKAHLQRLLATDEIISAEDPVLVAEAFNSIRQAAPEVTTNLPLLRLQLRQALQHQGVDIDTATAARKFHNEGVRSA